MKLGMVLYRLGALGFLLSVGIFREEPIFSSLKENPATWPSVFILYGFIVLTGIFLCFIRPQWLFQGKKTLMFFAHGAALLSILWLVLWCFVWLALIAKSGDKAEMLVKHTAYLHLFGVGFSMAGYATGWMMLRIGERSLRFLMTVGWAISYMAWFNLYLQPTLRWLWAPALGGLLVVFGAFLIERQLKRKVETACNL